MTRKLILYIAMSTDGYIATPTDGLDFLSMVEKEGEDYGYAAFCAGVDTIILGRKTYDKVLSMGYEYHPDKEVYVISRSKSGSSGKARFYSGSLTELVKQLKSVPGKDIYCDGGAEIVNELLKGKLFDEIIVSVIPILLGDGIRLFKDGRPEQKLQLHSATSYEKGLVQLRYFINQN